MANDDLRVLYLSSLYLKSQLTLKGHSHAVPFYLILIGCLRKEVKTIRLQIEVSHIV